MHTLTHFAADNSSNDYVTGGIGGLLVLIGLWFVFKKAGQPGWKGIIPIYNTYVLLKLVGRPGWWLILFFIPLVNVIMLLVLALDVAKAFGKGTAFAIFWLWLFPFVGYLILGFGDATYHGAPKHEPVM